MIPSWVQVTRKVGPQGGKGSQEGQQPGLRGAGQRLWTRLRAIQPPYVMEMVLMLYYGESTQLGSTPRLVILGKWHAGYGHMAF